MRHLKWASFALTGAYDNTPVNQTQGCDESQVLLLTYHRGRCPARAFAKNAILDVDQIILCVSPKLF